MKHVDLGHHDLFAAEMEVGGWDLLEQCPTFLVFDGEDVVISVLGWVLLGKSSPEFTSMFLPWRSWWFPVNFPLNSNESRDAGRVRQRGWSIHATGCSVRFGDFFFFLHSYGIYFPFMNDLWWWSFFHGYVKLPEGINLWWLNQKPLIPSNIARDPTHWWRRKVVVSRWAPSG